MTKEVVYGNDEGRLKEAVQAAILFGGFNAWVEPLNDKLYKFVAKMEYQGNFTKMMFFSFMRGYQAAKKWEQY